MVDHHKVVQVVKENFTWVMERWYLVGVGEIRVLLVAVVLGSNNGMVVEEEVLLLKVAVVLVDKVMVRVVDKELQ